MDLSATEIIAIIVAIGAVVVNIVMAFKSNGKIESISQVTARSLIETTALQGQVKEVHTLANSSLAEVKADLRESVAEIAALKEAVQDLRSQRDKVATAAAFATPVAATATDDNPLPVEIVADEPVPVEVHDELVKPLKPKKR